MQSGRRISEIIASGPMAADPLLAIGTALAEIVAAAHAQAETFGALAPTTVFVTDGGTVLILDAAATPISARREDDLRALGTLLYAMATGVTPHQAGRDRSDEPLVPSPIELNARLPSGLVRLIQRSVHPDPAHRFNSAEQIRDALREVRRAPGSLESLLPAEHVSSSAAVKPPPRPPADERGHDEADPCENGDPPGSLPFPE